MWATWTMSTMSTMSAMWVGAARRFRHCRHCRHCPRGRSEEHTSELQSQFHLVCRLLLEKKKKNKNHNNKIIQHQMFNLHYPHSMFICLICETNRAPCSKR